MEEDAARSLFMVASFDDSLHCAAIYEIKFGGGGEIKIDGPLVKAFSCSEKDYFSVVDCDMVGSQICLAASCELSGACKRKMISFEPLLFDTVTKQIDQLPKPQAKKPFPKVMAVGGSFYVLSTDTQCSGFHIKSPSFECFDPFHRKWDSVVPEYRVEKKSMAVVGYAVINDIILISVDATSNSSTEFHCYKIGSSMEKWQVVEKEDRYVRYYAFIGKSEFVDDFVYTWVDNCSLIAYHVTFSTGDDGDRTIKSLGAPVRFDSPKIPFEPYELYTSSLVHLGNKIFCVARTEIKRVPPKVQHVTIMILKFSDSMDPETVSAEVSADLYPLNTEGLGQANVRSLFLNSRWSEFDYESECWTSLKDRLEYLEDFSVNTHMQPMDIDPPKLESVPGGSETARKRAVSSASVLGNRTKYVLVNDFLKPLGLEKYSKIFEYEEISMHILVHMTDEDLKEIGLPKDPRKEILLALKSV